MGTGPGQVPNRSYNGVPLRAYRELGQGNLAPINLPHLT